MRLQESVSLQIANVLRLELMTLADHDPELLVDLATTLPRLTC